MTKLDHYWMTNEEWFEIKDDLTYIIKPDAPKEAQESYKRYIKQKRLKNK